jgi:hypothetical protein
MRRKATTVSSAGWCVVSEPLTWTILQSLKARVETISVDAGFYTDLGANVSLEAFRAADILQGASELVRIVSMSDALTDAEPPKGRSGPRSIAGSMDGFVEYVIPAARPDAHRQAHRGRADLVRVLRDDPRLWAPGVRGFSITGRQMLEQPDGLPVVVAQISWRADIYEATPPPAV